MPTRGEVAELLSGYAGNLNDFNIRLDRVRRELLKSNNCKGSKIPILLSLFTDVDSRTVVTLPQQYTNVLAGLANPPSEVVSPFCRMPLRVQNEWYETLSYNGRLWGACNRWGLDEVPGRFCTYQDWLTPVQLKFVTEATERTGNFLIQGTNNGAEVYYGSPFIRGENLPFTGASTFTTVNFFDARNLRIVKPQTIGRVFVSAINAIIPPAGGGTPPTVGVTTQVAILNPGETDPQWKRYYVPNITDPTSSQFLAICKLGFAKLVSDNDECVPGDIEAIRHGLEALKLGDAHDYVREKEEWQAAKECLIDETEDDQGAGATGKILVEDTFSVGRLGAEWGYGGWGWDADGGYW